MANSTLIKTNYRTISKAIDKLKKKEITTDDMLVTYRHATKELPDIYTKDGKENPIRPIAIAVANKNLSYAIRHYEKSIVDMGIEKVDQFNKIIKQNNGHKHWVLINSNNNELINPDTDTVLNLATNYQKGLHKDLQKSLKIETEKENDSLTL